MTTATAPLAVPAGLRFSREPHERTAAAVVASPRLLSAVPAAELAPLFRAWEGAAKAMEAAKALPVEGADVAAEADAALREGKDIDPAAIMTPIADAQAAADRRDRTVNFLAPFPKQYAREIASVLNRHRPAYFKALGEGLAELLEEAEPDVAALGGIENGDQAITAKKVAEWTAVKEYVARYSEIRAQQIRLLRLDEPVNFANGAPALAYSFFDADGIEDVAPDFIAEHRNRPTDLQGRPVSSMPFDLLAVDSVAHLLAVVRMRDRLRPHVIDADEAMDAYREVGSRMPLAGVPLEPGRMTAQHGSEKAALAYGVRIGQIREGRRRN